MWGFLLWPRQSAGPHQEACYSFTRARRVELASPFTTRKACEALTRKAGASARIGNGRLSRRPLFISSAMSLMALNRPREMSAGRPLSWVKLTRFGHRKSAAPDPKETCGPTPRIAYDSDLGVVVPLAFIGLEVGAGASRRRAVSQKLGWRTIFEIDQCWSGLCVACDWFSQIGRVIVDGWFFQERVFKTS